jgi:ABC-2 type transport system ATP-binding protein
VTVVLVTHFMDEAERLCDRVMLVDHGQVVALDTPAMLAERHGGGSRLSFQPSQPFDDSLLTRLPEVSGLQHKDGRVVVTGTGDVLGAVVHALDGVGVEPRNADLTTASLEDAFLRLTARPNTSSQQEVSP